MKPKKTECPYCKFSTIKGPKGLNRHIGQKHKGMRQVEIEHDVLWKPHPKQEQALVRDEYEILYGGARGGGKTDAGQAWLLYDVSHPRLRALVIRQNAKDLNDWVDRARRMYKPAGAIFKGQPTEIHFPSGAIIRTGHLKDENAYEQYQGHEYHRILLEELTQIPQEKYYEQLMASCRSTVGALKPQIFATTNPGGPGHEWVRERWGIPDEPEFGKVYSVDNGGRKRIFIPAGIDDNPTLIERDPMYIEMLDNLSDENLRRAWREGYWGDPIIEGVIYRGELTAARENGRITEVPHDPRHLVYTWWDIGIGDATTIGFFQKVGEAWRMIDYYEDSGKPIGHYAQVLNAKGYFYGRHYGPHDLEKREYSSGKSIRVIARDLGLDFTVVPKMGIEDGINAVRMKFPLLWIDKVKCKRLLTCLANYRYEMDDKLQKFKDKPRHDWASHAADMIRYWGVQRDPVDPNREDADFKLYTTDFN